jgi:hypothetical protein
MIRHGIQGAIFSLAVPYLNPLSWWGFLPHFLSRFLPRNQEISARLLDCSKKYEKREIESVSPQRRVCEPPVPQLASGDHVRRHLPAIANRQFKEFTA